MRRVLVTNMIAALLAVQIGCAPRLETPDDGPDAGPDVPNWPVDEESDEGGVVITRVKATDQELWVYMDLDTRAAVEPDVPETSDVWDLGFRRFHIKLNGGVSGAGGMEVAVLPEAAFADVTQAPADGYITDLPDDELDEDLDPEYVMSNGDTRWFDYSPATHVVMPNQNVYVLRSVEGDYYKLQMLSYYDNVGSPAYLRFQWAAVDPP